MEAEKQRRMEAARTADSVDSSRAGRAPNASGLTQFRPPLGHRGRFRLPAGLIYLDGNSLGPLPVGRRSGSPSVIDQEWGEGLIGSWNSAGWIDLPQRVGAKIASLIGAHDDEVIAADSTSVNLFKVLAAALQLRPERRTHPLRARQLSRPTSTSPRA